MKFYRPVQELILPRKATLYYGDMAITFDTFQRFFEKTDTIQALIGPTQFSKLASEEAWIGATRVSRIPHIPKATMGNAISPSQGPKH
jgi:hypothetical protein